MDIIDQLERLEAMWKRGSLTHDQFEGFKMKMLAGSDMDSVRKRKHVDVVDSADNESTSISLQQAGTSMRMRIAQEAKPILTKAPSATERAVLLQLGDGQWDHDEVSRIVTSAFEEQVRAEPELYGDVRNGRKSIKLGMGCSTFLGSGKKLKMERGQVHPAPRNGTASLQTYSEDKGYVRENTRILACGMGPISVTEQVQMSHEMNQHVEDVLITAARKVFGNAVLNSENAGGQGNHSHLDPTDPRLQRLQVKDVVRYVYINFLRRASAASNASNQ